MNILFDTNVILDWLLLREPFAADAGQAIAAAEIGQINGYLCATTITTLHYLIRKHKSADETRVALRTLMNIFSVAGVTRTVIEAALLSKINDFEDAVLYAAAVQVGATAIVTRNPRDFAHDRLPVYSAQELLTLLKL